MKRLPLLELPAPRGEVSVWMDAPPAAVWDLVSDVTRIGEFSPETFEARWTRGSTGPEVGAYFKGHVKRNGVGPTYWSLCRVTRCVPEEVFEFAVGTDDLNVNNWGYRLDPREAAPRSPSTSGSAPTCRRGSTGSCSARCADVRTGAGCARPSSG